MFSDDDKKIVMDIHVYKAFGAQMNTTQQVCDGYAQNISNNVADVKYPVWVGEWSLATDVCAMFLLGFNGGRSPPQDKCDWKPCPGSYLPEDFAVDFDRKAAILPPYGDNAEDYCVQNGMCSSDSLHFDKKDVQEIAECTLRTIQKYATANMFWTAHNQIEPRWDYVKAYDNGWLKPHTPVSEPLEFT